MPFFMRHRLFLFTARLGKHKLRAALYGYLLLFMVTWPLMWLVEPSDNEIRNPLNFLWYMVVSSSTVGYGDFFPKTQTGHLLGAIDIIGGVSVFATVLTAIAQAYLERKKKMASGQHQLNLKGHVVLVGYHANRTAHLIRELQNDHDLSVVICADPNVVSEHPLADMSNVHFVAGELRSLDVMRRADVSNARSVIIDVANDDIVQSIVVAVRKISLNIHVVAVMHEMEDAYIIQLVSDDDSPIECVPHGQIAMIARASLYEGVAEALHDLMSSAGDGGDIFTLTVPEHVGSITYGVLQAAFASFYQASIMAIQTETCEGRARSFSPSVDTVVEAGQELVYTSCREVAINDWGTLAALKLSLA